MRKYLKTMGFFVLTVLLSIQQALPVGAWEESLSCTVLGDSIAKGYSSDKSIEIKSYGQIVTERVAGEAGIPYTYKNFAKNGLATAGLNEKILAKDEVLESLENADIILVTMGSNDLLNEFKKEAQAILDTDTKFKSAGEALNEVKAAVKDNPLLVLKIIDALGNWDYGAFEGEWIKAMDTITAHKKEDSQIIVTNIYNPVHNMELPGTMNKIVEDIIQNMNKMIEKRAEEYGYQVVDLFQSDIVAFVQDDGLHPDQEGQELIADLVYKQLAVQEQDKARSVDGAAVKGEETGEEGAGSETAENDGTGASTEEAETIEGTKEDSLEDKERQNRKEAKEKVQDAKPAKWGGLAILVIILLAWAALTLKNARRGKKGK